MGVLLCCAAGPGQSPPPPAWCGRRPSTGRNQGARGSRRTAASRVPNRAPQERAHGLAATGAVAAGAGLSVLLAAVRYDPSQAKGLDETLHSFAATPAGPALLIAAAVGLPDLPHGQVERRRSAAAAVIPRLIARVRFPSSAPRQSPGSVTWGLFIV
ncbi:DUF1206 domain-containing protein [Streptomyces sp. NPDC093089]|uniref:DUF1206 domain-containing protein n=1 Tax=Streptomyces sp. NPDC093089 TaxID=3366024 RepID=UPI003801263E